MLVEVFLLLVLISSGFLLLGYSTQTLFFAIFGFAILFFLGTTLMGLGADDGILFKVGENESVSYFYDNGSLVETSNSKNFVYTNYNNFLFGLIMTFISLMGIYLILMHTRSGGFDDE